MNMFYLQSVKRTFIVIFQEDHPPNSNMVTILKHPLLEKQTEL